MTGFTKLYCKHDKNGSLGFITGGVERLFSNLFYPSRRRLRRLIQCAALFVPFGPISSVADVFDVTATDVTTRALSAAWVSNEPVSSATIRVFADQDGLTDITSSLTITTDSELVNPAHAQGIVKVTATGLSADTDYFIQTETVSSSGVFAFPATPPFMRVHTALETTKVNAVNNPIVNDLLSQDVFFPDGITPAPGSLVFVEAVGLSAYPLTAFVGVDGFDLQSAIVDTNNFFDINGTSLELQADDALKVSVFRGLICSTDFAHQGFFGFRRTPAHEETPSITEVEAPFNCFTSDPICDNDVNILDVQFIINSIDTSLGDCGFNPNVDVIADNDINILDIQRIINDIDTTVPNKP